MKVIKPTKYDIDIQDLYLTSLPDWLGEVDIVYGNFWCGNNMLTSLKNCPKKILGSFGCSTNRITSLEGCPKAVTGAFYCLNNPGKFTAEDIRSVCKVGGNIIVL